MAQEMTGPGTGHGLLSSLAQRVKGGAGGSHVGKKGPLEGVYLTQLIPTLLILILSVITMLSCSIALGTVSLFNHVAGMALGIAAAVVVWRYDYRNLSNLTTALFVVSCVLLALPLVPGLGVEGDLGGLGWVHFGPFRFQPSEPAKLVIIALMASACAQYNGKIESFADYAKLCGTLLVPLLLILVTDLGTGLMIFFTGATIIICSGAPRGWILATIALIVGVAALVIITSQIEGIPHILQEYQLARLTVFLDPEGTASEDGYNLQQAMIAIGSGGLLGLGLGQSRQKYLYLPEPQNDFIFAIVCEELGFIGALIIIVLFAMLIWRGIVVSLKAKDKFGMLLGVGLTFQIGLQVILNIMVVTNTIPNTGISLPFFSYGGTSLIMLLAEMGVVLSISRNSAIEKL